jgi:hypothetical protein
MSEKSSEANLAFTGFNVAEVPEADIQGSF